MSTSTQAIDFLNLNLGLSISHDGHPGHIHTMTSLIKNPEGEAYKVEIREERRERETVVDEERVDRVGK